MQGEELRQAAGLEGRGFPVAVMEGVSHSPLP